MVFAKSPNIQREMRSQWQSNGISYICLCEGKPNTTNGEFQVYKGCDKHGIGDQDNPKPIETMRYRVLSTSPRDRNMCMIELYPEPSHCPYIIHTLQQAGCVVAGTRDEEENTINPLRRIGLHASELKLKHPTTGELLTVKSQTPSSFERLMLQTNDDDNNNNNGLEATLVEPEIGYHELGGSDEIDDDDTLPECYAKSIKVVTVEDYLKSSGGIRSDDRHKSQSKSKRK